MSKINELVRLEDLALAYQQIIGNRFDIKVNASLDIEDSKEKGVMFATRQPYKISNIKAESLQIALRFYTCCENEEVYNNTIQILSQLVGLNKGTFTSNRKTYRFFSFLDFTQPISEPIVDTGKFHQELEIMGSCLVTQTSGGVLIGNEVETLIKFSGDTSFSPLEVLAASTTISKAQEASHMANSDVAKAFNNTQSYSYSYSILMMKNAVCERILKAVYNIQAFGLNEEIFIKEKYPAFVDGEIISEKSLVLTGASIDRNAGAFVTANITLQDRLNIETLD